MNRSMLGTPMWKAFSLLSLGRAEHDSQRAINSNNEMSDNDSDKECSLFVAGVYSISQLSCIQFGGIRIFKMQYILFDTCRGQGPNPVTYLMVWGISIWYHFWLQNFVLQLQASLKVIVIIFIKTKEPRTNFPGSITWLVLAFNVPHSTPDP